MLARLTGMSKRVFIIIFFLLHLHMAILDDVEERDGLLSSIFNGVK